MPSRAIWPGYNHQVSQVLFFYRTHTNQPERVWAVLIGLSSAVLAVDAALGWRIPPKSIGYVVLAFSIAATALLPARHVLLLWALWLMSPVSANGNTLQSSIAVWALLACLVVAGAREHRIRQWPLPRALLIGQALLLGTVAVYAAVGLLRHHSPLLVLWDVQPFLEFAVVALLAAVVLRETSDRRFLVLGLAVGSGVKALWDLWYLVSNIGHWLHQNSALIAILASRAFDAAPFLLLPLFVALMFRPGVGRFELRLLAAASSMTVLALVLSVSRTNWLGAVAGVSTVAATARGRLGRRIVVFGAITMLVGGLAVIATPQGRDVFGARIVYTMAQIAAPSTSYLGRRQEELALAWPSIVDSKFLGLGAGAELPLNIPSYLSPNEEATGQVPYLHDYYLLLLLEMGAPGLLALLGLVVLWLTTLARAATNVGIEGALAAGAIGAWVMGSIQLAFLSTPVLFHTAALMALIAVLGLSTTARGGITTRSNSGAFDASPAPHKEASAT